MMEFEEAQDNLCAIRLLYRLLEDNVNALKVSNSENVVERARVLLKSLLDVAVEIVFETHLKITATQAGNSKTSIEQEKHVTVPQSKFSMATNMSKTSEKYQTSHEMATQKNGQPQLELLCKKELSNFSMSDNGGTESKTLSSLGEENGMMQQNRSNEGTSPNIDSNHHEQHHNNVNVLYGLGDHAEESLQMLDKKSGESNDDNTMPLLNNIREVECNSSAARFAECLAQKSDFSDDLVNAIKRIESRILAFKICSNMVDSIKNGTVRDPSHKVANLGSPKLQRKDSAARSQLSSKRPLWEGHRLMNQHTCDSSSKGENLITANAVEEPFLSRNELSNQSQVAYQNCDSSSKGENLITANAVEEPFLSRNELSNQSQVAYQNCGLHTNPESAKSNIPKHISTQTVSVREELRSGTRIQPSVQNKVFVDRVKSLNRLVSGDSHFGNQASECIQGLRVPLNQDNLTKKSSMFGSQTNKESLVRKTPVAGWSKTDPKQKERNSESSHAQKLARSTPNVARRDKLPPHQMVIKPTLLDQRSSEIKVNSHQHRDGSVLDRRGSHKTGHAEPSKTRVRPQLREPEESSSNSDSSSQSTSQQDSANTSSQSEDSLSVGTQGSKSGRMVDASYEGNSEESSDSYLNKEDDPSYRVGSFQSYGHRNKGNPKKTVGGLKRLKNKLGLIFHHHHHHHHHHHLDGDNGSIHSYEGPRHSMWNNLQNVFHHKNKHGMITNHKDEKTRRGAITKYSPRRNQVGQFHRLVEGLLRYIRHSKKPKPSKNGWVKGSKNTAHGHRKKKPHWWQILPRRREVKLKNKGRVKKMGFISQKSLKN